MQRINILSYFLYNRMLIRQGFPTLFYGHHARENKFLPKGFAANAVLIFWAVLGSVIGYAFLANFLTMLIKPVLEEPIDSVQTIVDRGMVPITYYNGQFWKEFLKSSANPMYRQLANITIVPKDKNEWLNLIKERILKDGTSVYMISKIPTDELDPADFYKSKDVLEGDYPYGGWIVNKKWPLSEKLSQHILRWQQVRVWFGQNSQYDQQDQHFHHVHF